MEKPSLRERKKTRTRENLIDISTRLFLEKGFDSTTIDEIVEEAELSQRTFFRYFPTKEAVLFWDHDRRAGRLNERLQEGADVLNPFERLSSALVALGDEYERDQERLLTEYRIVMSSKMLTAVDMEHDLKLQKAMANTLRTWNGKQFLSKRQANLVAGAIFGSVRALMEEWFEGGCKQNLKRLSKEFLHIVDVLAAGYKLDADGKD